MSTGGTGGHWGINPRKNIQSTDDPDPVGTAAGYSPPGHHKDKGILGSLKEALKPGDLKEPLRPEDAKVPLDPPDARRHGGIADALKPSRRDYDDRSAPRRPGDPPRDPPHRDATGVAGVVDSMLPGRSGRRRSSLLDKLTGKDKDPDPRDRKPEPFGRRVDPTDTPPDAPRGARLGIRDDPGAVGQERKGRDGKDSTVKPDLGGRNLRFDKFPATSNYLGPPPKGAVRDPPNSDVGDLHDQVGDFDDWSAPRSSLSDPPPDGTRKRK
ncbi:hypothetical protein F4778DRAFT_783632 [Xylariomycetidae sp. FL2044]|nr:hypothetical protein F4778DRAFT_783632 [Xylariomycetidae sp. FL2044]